MKKILFLLLLLIFTACKTTVAPTINSFEDCVAAGNPIMESNPRMCSANGQTFTEEIVNSNSFHMCTEAEKQNQACTRDYRPVCAYVDNGIRCITTPCQSTDAKDFSNGCSACSAKSLGYYEGNCIDQTFVVCKETTTGFSAEKFAQDSGGICVEICPGNYDSYTTQTGIQLCIEHYGLEEIEQWQTCTRSTDSCDCVKAVETTLGEQIQNPEYRCVPNRYADRLLFRSGTDRLDENGESSVVIA